MNTKRRPKRSKNTKAKKPKFLSLRLQFPADESKRSETPADAAVPNSDHPDLSPIQSQNQAEERENNDHENVAFFFSAADGGATTLTGLLDASTAAESNSSHTEKNSSRLGYLPAAVYGEERAALVRNAMRSRDRDSSEDKWVCYSEVVKEEEVSSSSAVCPPVFQRVSLKLDYEEIMNAWSNKGPLYVDNSQVVPDVNHHDFLSQELTNIHGLTWGCNNNIGGSWAVPEMARETGNGEAVRNKEREMKMGQREASVLRYKEKRQNRLFSRKIRYQVRKLNAEKRPRLKGRFVKRS